MPNRRRQRLNAARLLVLSLWALLTPAAGPAATERSQGSGMCAIARTEIRIALSVRQTMSIRPTVAGPGDGSQQQGRSFCVWSNSPMSQYNVIIEIQRELDISRPPAVVQSGNPGCLTQGPVITLLNKLDASLNDAHPSNLVTLVISPD